MYRKSDYLTQILYVKLFFLSNIPASLYAFYSTLASFALTIVLHQRQYPQPEYVFNKALYL